MTNPTSLLIPALAALVAVPALRADTTGRIAGTVKDSAGRPVPNAVLTLSRVDVSWKKELKTDEKGNFMQVGLDPKDFDVTVAAPGFSNLKDRVKVPLGEVLMKNYVLLTPEEAAKSGAPSSNPAAAAENESIKAEQEATEAYNAGAGFYSSKDYAKALAPSQQAAKAFRDALAKASDETAKVDLEDKAAKANRLLGMVYFNLGKAEEAKPILAKHLEKNPKDAPVVNAMLKMAQDGKDKESEAKYQRLMDEITGPQPEIPYNEGVVALNAGNFKAAKESALKALKVKADYADAYYILGIAEFGMNNMKAAKESLRKYLELAPNGKKAGEVKEMLHSF
ncbi:MAG: carboxypeptidase regulatory-like domain-containing protein [Holophagaceae bacterium]